MNSRRVSGRLHQSSAMPKAGIYTFSPHVSDCYTEPKIGTPYPDYLQRLNNHLKESDISFTPSSWPTFSATMYAQLHKPQSAASTTNARERDRQRSPGRPHPLPLGASCVFRALLAGVVILNSPLSFSDCNAFASAPPACLRRR